MNPELIRLYKAVLKENRRVLEYSYNETHDFFNVVVEAHKVQPEVQKGVWREHIYLDPNWPNTPFQK